MTVIKNEEDRRFLESMKTDRLVSFGSVDKKKVYRDMRKDRRLLAELSRQEHYKSSRTQSTNLPDSDSSSTDDNEDEETKDTSVKDISKKRSHHHSKYAGTSAFIPHDILKRPSVVSVATRLNKSNATNCTY